MTTERVSEPTTDTDWSSRLARFGVLFALGALGVVALVATTNPGVYETAAAAAGLPVAAVVVLSAVPSLVLVAVAVVLGLWLAPKVGLRSHLLDRVSDGTPLVGALRPELPRALAGGLAVGGLLLVLSVVAPTPAGGATEPTTGALLASLPTRLLYGGITEEILLRWGLLSAVAAALRRLTGGERGTLSTAAGWTAVVVSAVLFGVGHLPAALGVYGALTPEVLAFVIGGNTLAGIVFGWLYWRDSLEAAMVAHALGHVVAVGTTLVLVA